MDNCKINDIYTVTKHSEKKDKILLSDGIYILGICLLVLSLIFYFIPNVSGITSYWPANCAITFIYWLTIIIYALCRRKNFNAGYIFSGLIISLISCYTLNQEIRIFPPSPLWFGILIFVSSFAYLLLPFYNNFNKYIQSITAFSAGIGSILFLYLTIYLLPGIEIGVMFCWFFGLSLHLLVPLLFVVFIIWWVFKHKNYDCWFYSFFFSGIGSSLLIIIIFSMNWAKTIENIQQTPEVDKAMSSDHLIPDWMQVAQNIHPDRMTEMVLKTDIIYYVPSRIFWDLDMGISQSEKIIHHPLVIISSWLYGKTKLENDEKKKLLQIFYNEHNEFSDRFWRGDGIKTTDINTSIQIWPQFRLAYTEQVFELKNCHNWGREEAIYTFSLPEGSVISSLSLWIDGEERKGVLTSRAKADSAYTRIVGIEARDPAVTFWMEDSKALVRIFPVNPNESRKFKIGITSPLLDENSYLQYKPIRFSGTNYSKAIENIKVKFMQTTNLISTPSFLEKKEKDNYHYKGKIENNWTIKMIKPALSSESFSFDDYSYTLQQLKKTVISVNITDIYLDINSSWTNEEVNQVINACKHKNIWLFNNYKWVKYDDNTKNNLIKKELSIFPVFLIENRENSLCISKSTVNSFKLQDLMYTNFIKNTNPDSNPKSRILFFNIGDITASYLKALAEYQILNYYKGSIQELIKVLATNTFPVYEENENNIAIPCANISINRSFKSYPSKAPNHLMRLFSYNYILKNYTGTWQEDTLLRAKLETESTLANIVSPVSSLIVLETKEDYERFNINEKYNSIFNADTDKEEGYTPIDDPGLIESIILISLMFLIFKIRRRKQMKQSM